MGRPGLSLDRKFKRLARSLDDVQAGFGEMLARGALELLWDSAYEACDDYLGDVDDVEAQAHWRGKRGTLLAGLAGAGGEGRAGFVDEGGSEWWPDGKPGTYRVHDLWDHAPEYAAKRAAREAEREAAGVSLSAIRSAAGKKGRAAQLGQTGQNQASGEQAAGECPANGGQTDAICRGEAGKTRANGVPPTPTPTPTPLNNRLPSKDELTAKRHPTTQALLDLLADEGYGLTHPKAQADELEEALKVLGIEDVARGLAQDLASNQGVGSLGYYARKLIAAAKRPASKAPSAAPAAPTPDLSWIDSLPADAQAAARAEWDARRAGVEAEFKPDARPRVLSFTADALRQEFAS